MVVRNTFLIVLFAILLSHSVIAQSTDESTLSSSIITTPIPSTTTPIPSTTTPISNTTETISNTTTVSVPTTSCADSGEFPLFSNDVCISRTAYTAIFLTSIILAGVSFLMLIGLLILFCVRSSGSSGLSYSDDDDSNPWKGNNINGVPPMNRRDGQYTAVLQNDKQIPAAASSAPYTDAKPVATHTTRTEQTTTTQPKNINQKPSESLEMTPRTTKRSPTNNYRGGNRTDNNVSNKETETSYF